jgi:cell division protein FtsL
MKKIISTLIISSFLSFNISAEEVINIDLKNDIATKREKIQDRRQLRQENRKEVREERRSDRKENRTKKRELRKEKNI